MGAKIDPQRLGDLFEIVDGSFVLIGDTPGAIYTSATEVRLIYDAWVEDQEVQCGECREETANMAFIDFGDGEVWQICPKCTMVLCRTFNELDLRIDHV